MIQYIWLLLLLLGSSYVYMQSEIHTSLQKNTSKTATKKKTVSTALTAATGSASGNINATIFSRKSKAVSQNEEIDARNTRESRLLAGETMGGLTNCDSFVVGDRNKKEFYSPNYPMNYTPSTTCTRVLQADSKDERVVVDFRDRFDMEPSEPSENCRYDHLEVRDGAHGYSAERGRFCGDKFPEKITSTGSNLWLRFYSDDSIEKQGFRAVYWFEKRNISEEELNQQPCIINKTESDGNFNLSALDVPDEFREKANKSGIDCMFNIYVEKEKSVSLSWDEFNLQYPNDCELNYVNILDENSDTIKQKFCGAAAEPIQFNSNQVQIQYVVQKSAVNSSFLAHFTPFRKSINCTAEEFDCQDGNCIALSLQCNGVNNCVTASDEDAEECKKEESLMEQFTKVDLLIILIVFFVILFGMCFTLIFNVVRKLIHDFSVIKEHVHQSRESQLDQLGRKTPTATILTPLVTVLPNLTDSLITGNEIRASIHANPGPNDEDDCYVPTEHTFPSIISKEYGFDRMNGGPRYIHSGCHRRSDSNRDCHVEEDEDGLATHSGGDSASYMPEMRDNECQTRESLFYNTPSSIDCDSTAIKKAVSPISLSPAIYTVQGDSPHAMKPAANALPSVAIPPPVGFTTFGYTNNQKPTDNRSTMKNAKAHRFRAEAVIEMDRFNKQSPNRDLPPKQADTRQNRPYSVQSTKSAPDVIVTH